MTYPDQTAPTRSPKQIVSYALFLREYMRNPRRTASVCPSSPALSRSMAESIDFTWARTIVELGAGTGAVTRAIVDRLPSDARLYAVDNNASFVEHLKQAFPDSRVIPVHGQAGELKPTLRAHGVNQADVIVSSLGFTSMLPAERESVLKHIVSCLQPHGVLIQYQYLSSRWKWLTAGKSHWPFEAEELLRTCFRAVATKDVMWNIPPARVFVCSEPFEMRVR
jgi:phosphatidylethanolamine/phosphatidyl-N-methylethanolamine N-methyltransferase